MYPDSAQSQKRKKKNMKSKKPSINQTMTNSPGGMQAGRDLIVSQGAKPRRLTPEQKRTLLEMLRDAPKGEIMVLCNAFAGTEPCDFANEIVSVLNDQVAGWRAKL